MESFKRELRWVTPLVIAVAVALNVFVGQLALNFQIPLYLDTIGTILVGALIGPWSAALTGYLASITWAATGLFPQALAWSGVAIVVGILAGVFTSWGWMRQWWNAVTSGLVTGVIAALIAAPVTAIVFGNSVGVSGTDLVTDIFRSFGFDALISNLAQGTFSDPLDKAISFLAVWGVLKLIPQGFKQRFRPATE